MNLREAAQQALNALEKYQEKGAPFMECDSAVTALRAALAEATIKDNLTVEPVAWMHELEGVATLNMTPPNYYGDHWKHTALYTAPPKREPLTAPQIHEQDWPDDVAFEDILKFTRAIERAHGIGSEK